VIPAYLGYNIAAIQKQLAGIASLFKEIWGKIPTCVIDSTLHINKTILCSGSNYIDHISEEFLNSLDGQIKINVDPILYRFFCKDTFPSGVSSLISYIYLSTSY
jgi:hypothetical protein